MPVPDPATASALLTAESLIIAALAVISQRDSLRNQLDTTPRRRTVMFLSVVVSILIAISFLATIAYLHVAQYPNGIIGSSFDSQGVFNIAVFSLIGLVYVSLSAGMWLYVSWLKSQMNSPSNNSSS